jgi:hypothetical protein
MNLATDDGVLNLAGLLLFAELPQRFKPAFVVKAVKYPGTDIHTSKYDDTEDFAGPLRRVFDDALAFVMRNLRKVQAGRGVNSPGVPEIPPVAFEELLVNALVHRDYLISAPIRLFIFDDRIEIISPGTLPNNLTAWRRGRRRRRRSRSSRRSRWRRPAGDRTRATRQARAAGHRGAARPGRRGRARATRDAGSASRRSRRSRRPGRPPARGLSRRRPRNRAASSALTAVRAPTLVAWKLRGLE